MTQNMQIKTKLPRGVWQLCTTRDSKVSEIAGEEPSRLRSLGSSGSLVLRNDTTVGEAGEHWGRLQSSSPGRTRTIIQTQLQHFTKTCATIISLQEPECEKMLESVWVSPADPTHTEHGQSTMDVAMCVVLMLLYLKACCKFLNLSTLLPLSILWFIIETLKLFTAGS